MKLAQTSFFPGARAKSTGPVFLAAAVLLGLAPGMGGQVTGAAVSAPSAATAPSAPQTTTMAPTGSATPNQTNSAVQTTTQTTTDANRSDAARNQRATSDQSTTAPARLDALTEFQQMVGQSTGRPLPIFGASLFDAPPSTFAPVDDVNVGPGYIVGPGDELRLQLSGQVNQQFTFTVDRTGAISFPGIGPIHVAGVSFGDLPVFLRAQIGKIYRNFDLSVNLGALRTIQVFVVGQARRPGTYSVSSLATLLNAIFASGGPLPTGSLRDIQVKRAGRTITHFDLYDLLLRGDKTKDIGLATGDVIFIPIVGPEVAVVGSVNTSAIYELRGETTVAQVVALTGGLTNIAAGAGARLERVADHRMRSVEDVQSPATSTVEVHDGDILSISSIVERFGNAVTLRGNVANPGRYVWHEGMHISDLIPNKESLITRDYWRKRNALGQFAGADYGPVSGGEGSLNARGAAPGTGAIRDQGAPTTASADAGGSSIGGALTPGNTSFSPQTDVLLSAPDIDWAYAVIERQSTTTLTTSLLPFNLGKIILDGDAKENLELLPGDVVTIFSKADIHVPSLQQTRYIRLEGEFAGAGVYSVRPGERLRDVLRRAGGFTGEAYLFGSEFTRESTRRLEAQRYREFANQLEAQISSTTARNQARALGVADQAAANASAADAFNAVGRLRSVQPIGRIVLDLKPESHSIESVPDLELEDGDRFIVPRLPSNVNVEGQVYSANAFVFTPGRRVLDYLREAGGPDRQADHKRVFVLRADGSVVSRQYHNVDRAMIYPGDTIVVPPQIDKRAGYQRILDIATIVSQFTLGAATVAILSR